MTHLASHNSTVRYGDSRSAAVVASGGGNAAKPSPYTMINTAAAQGSIDVLPLRGGVNVLSGSGGNIAVLSGPDGLLMVDAGIAVSEPKIASALSALGSGHPRYLISTHWHFDHTDGNAWIHAAGASIIAHANTLRHLKETIRIEEWDHTFMPVPDGALPTLAITAETVLTFNGETIVLRPYAPAHTDSDLSVYFAEADVLHVADTWWNGHYPFIDYVTGGSIDGSIRAAQANLSLATEETLVVSGHGLPGRRADLFAYRDMLVDVRERVGTLKAHGLPVDAVVEARPTAPYDAVWGRSVVDPALFTALVYRGV